MKSLIFFTLILILVSCGKTQNDFDKPLAHFNFRTQYGEMYYNQFITAPDLIFGTKNYSENSEDYNWNFADIIHLNNFEPEYSFGSAGTYQVILTASNEFSTDTVSKYIVVNERQIKRITINSIDWHNGFDQVLNWGSEAKANVFVRIYEADVNLDVTRIGSDYDANLIYESEKYELSGFDENVSIQVNDNIPLRHKRNKKTKQIICMYAEKNGVNYLLLSDLGSMVGLNFTDYMSETFYSISFGGTKMTVYAIF
jgi:hypothetical protein